MINLLFFFCTHDTNLNFSDYIVFFFLCIQQGYFQLKAYPGSFVLQLRNGRSASIYKIDR